MILTTLSTVTMAKNKFKEVKIVKRSETIHVSADKLWDIIGPGFANASHWSTNVDHSVGSGTPEFEGATCSSRSCDVNAKGFNKIDEKLTLYNASNKELTYEITDGNPGFVVLASNNWKVIDLGNNQSALEMNLEFKMKKFMGFLMGGMLNKNINSFVPVIFKDLKIYAETGEISDDKKERLKKLATKN